MYAPYTYSQINAAEGTFTPSQVKPYNNVAFSYWQRSLFHRAASVIEFEGLPRGWDGPVEDFLYYSLFRFGFVVITRRPEYGLIFNPATVYGFDLYYQPTNAVITNPAFPNSLDLTIGEDCELLKLTPDYTGIFDVIDYYAEKLASLDNAINVSIINNKFTYFLGARNKSAASAIKKALDKANGGEPAVVLDVNLLDDPDDKSTPWQFFERQNLKQSYITTDQLRDFQTILNNFDAEIGIPVIPYEKRERMVQSEAESRMIDSTSRSRTWLRTLRSSIERVRKLYPEFNVSVTTIWEDTEERRDEDAGETVDTWTL